MINALQEIVNAHPNLKPIVELQIELGHDQFQIYEYLHHLKETPGIDPIQTYIDMITAEYHNAEHVKETLAKIDEMTREELEDQLNHYDENVEPTEDNSFAPHNAQVFLKRIKERLK